MFYKVSLHAKKYQTRLPSSTGSVLVIPSWLRQQVTQKYGGSFGNRRTLETKLSGGALSIAAEFMGHLYSKQWRNMSLALGYREALLCWAYLLGSCMLEWISPLDTQSLSQMFCWFWAMRTAKAEKSYQQLTIYSMCHKL